MLLYRYGKETSFSGWMCLTGGEGLRLNSPRRVPRASVEWVACPDQSSKCVEKDWSWMGRRWASLKSGIGEVRFGGDGPGKQRSRPETYLPARQFAHEAVPPRWTSACIAPHAVRLRHPLDGIRRELAIGYCTSGPVRRQHSSNVADDWSAATIMPAVISRLVWS
jgi:hypothetical protein